MLYRSLEYNRVLHVYGLFHFPTCFTEYNWLKVPKTWPGIPRLSQISNIEMTKSLPRIDLLADCVPSTEVPTRTRCRSRIRLYSLQYYRSQIDGLQYFLFSITYPLVGGLGVNI